MTLDDDRRKRREAQLWNLRSRRWAIAVEEMSARAEACGYRVDRAISRLYLSSFVSIANRYAYFETPKCGSTSIKHMIAMLEGADLSRLNTAADGYSSRPEMKIHVRELLPIKPFLCVPTLFRDAIREAWPQWFVFSIVRNPFSRLVSVFESKVRLGEPNYRALEACYGDRAFANAAAAFQAYVADVVAEPAGREADHHLWPMVEFVMPKLLRYTRIFRVEQLCALFSEWQRHLDSRRKGGSISNVRFNASFGEGMPWKLYYDEPTARAVAEIYHEDFAAFGYDSSDWRPDRPTEFVESQEARYWRAEVVKRNVLIEELYAKLKNSMLS